MTQNYKRIVKNTMFLYFRMIIIMAVSFYTVRVVLDVLGVTDYGLYNLVASFVMMMTFLNSTLTSGTQRFLTFEIGKNNLGRLKKTFSIALLLHIGIALLVLLFGETIGLWFLYEKMNIPTERFDAVFWAYQFAIFSTMVSVTQVPYNALIIAHEKMHIYAYVSIVEVILKLLIVYLLLISLYDKLITYGVLMFVASFSIALYYRWYVTKNYQESHFEYSFDKEIVKPMLHFSGWNIFGTTGAILSNQGTNILLNIFFGPVAVAARAISMQVSDGLALFANGFQQAITPQITKLYAANKIEEMNELLHQNSKYAFLLLWLLALPVLVQLDYILNLWLIEVPENTILFCQLVIIHGLIISLNRPYSRAIHATGNMKQTNLSAGLLFLLVIPVSYILLKQGFSIVTPFFVYIGATVLNFIIEIYYLKKWINVSVLRLFISSLMPVIAIAIISTMIVYIVIDLIENSFIKFISVSFFSMLVVSLLVYIIALNATERSKLKILIQNKIKSI